ncbi:MAG: SpoIID/LytB domain-containing protein [Bacteroidales bacterium]|nr:SpoIID/LytB domain-containing protein [Bacteroidales bacterium]
MNSNNEPIVRVGIIEAPRVRYIYKGVEHEAVWSPDFEEIFLSEGGFTLRGVTIGKQFHWEQQEDQTFTGALRIIATPAEEGREGLLIAINEVPLESYLASVISSEMSATNNLELLKAHAIISRSWVMLKVRGNRAEVRDSAAKNTPPRGEMEEVFWDHDDHTLYDVCADDHCQRYQGTTRQVSPLVAEAIRQTRGVVLTSPELSTADHLHICDARFYKACGGRTERFSACWQDRDYPYLTPIDDPYCSPEFIATLPGGMEGVMQLVLNDYDRSTVDYHEWTERYTVDELSALVDRRLHEVFPDAPHLGRITALEPVERGASGRIVRLRIVGTPSAPDQAPPSIVIGKELLIRKVLSTSHLKSSWFDVTFTPNTKTTITAENTPSSGETEGVILYGHGWGHGVGLCQIGAAAMSLAGYTHDQILAHYYHGSALTRLYD